MVAATATPAKSSGTVSESSIASAFLNELGAPDTPAMRLAVITWMRSESGHTIIGNNVFNMRPGTKASDPLAIGSRVSPGNGSFSVYATPEDGARAAADRLVGAGTDWRKYNAIVSAARKGSAVAFLNAIASSAWDSSHYGAVNGGKNKLLARYASAATPGTDVLQRAGGGPTINTSNPTSGGINDPTATTPTAAGNLGAWASQVTFPVGHVLTAQDVQSIMSTLVGNGWFAGDVNGTAQAQTETVLNGEIGKPWNDALEKDIQSKLMTAATASNPLGGLGAIAGDVAQVIGAAFDPRKWILILALIAGTALTAWGGANVLRAAA